VNPSRHPITPHSLGRLTGQTSMTYQTKFSQQRRAKITMKRDKNQRRKREFQSGEDPSIAIPALTRMRMMKMIVKMMIQRNQPKKNRTMTSLLDLGLKAKWDRKVALLLTQTFTLPPSMWHRFPTGMRYPPKTDGSPTTRRYVSVPVIASASLSNTRLVP
jgi:hypothetical protein